MKRKWLRTVLWVLLTPIILFIMLMISLYLPPVQNLIRRQATAIASEATGMDISVERIDLRFPLNLLIRGVRVVRPAGADGVQGPDTLLDLRSLNVRVQAMPLLRGKVEVDEVTLKQTAVNSSDLIAGMRIKGMLGHFSLASHGIDLTREEVVLDKVVLSDTRVQVTLADTARTPEDTTRTAVNWRVILHALKLKNLSVDLQMPLDSMRMTARLGEAELADAAADLKRGSYGWKKFILSGTSVNYDSGRMHPVDSTALHHADSTALHSGNALRLVTAALPPSVGFDPSHIAVRDLRIGIDSVLYCEKNLNAVVREFSMSERSGLSVTSLSGSLFADSSTLRIPDLRLLTPHSEMRFTAQAARELLHAPATTPLSARFDAHIGKQDVLLFAGGLPEGFRKAYPFRPLVIHAAMEGTPEEMRLSRFTVDLPGAFSMNGGGEFRNLTDTLSRNGRLDLVMQTQNLDFLSEFLAATSGGAMAVPDSMSFTGRFGIEGSRCTVALNLKEGEGALTLDAACDLAAETYQADLRAAALQMHHFLPKDSLYALTANLSAKGKGLDPTSRKAVATLDASLQKLRYGHWDVSDVELRAGLKASVATVRIVSDNALLKMRGEADIRTDRRYPDGKIEVSVRELDLYKLGIAPLPLKHPFAFELGAEARRDSLRLDLKAGDLDLRFRASCSPEKLLKQSGEFVSTLAGQIKERRLDHAALRRVLPSAGMYLRAGKENPAGYFLATKGIRFDDFRVGFGFTPRIGINGLATMYGLRVDSLRLDTLFFQMKQDTARMQLQGGVINGPKNPQFVFRSTLTGEIRNEDAELTVDYVDGAGKTGVLFGVNARPLTEGRGKGDGMVLHLIPEEPVIAFRKFRFEGGSNWVYLHKNLHVYADVDMSSDNGLAFRMQSDRSDTVSLQNMNVELSRLQLSDLSGVLPYMPRLTGLFSAEARYIQTSSTLQVSAEAAVNGLTYERRPVGDIGVGATWLPGDGGTHYLDSYCMVDDQQVLTASGVLNRKNGKDSLEVSATLEHFPLKPADAFVPDRMVSFTGAVDGNLSISGPVEKPLVEGDISLDSVSVYARQAGARYWFDTRPLQIKDNRLIFDRFSIYTTGDNPFVIGGKVDFRRPERPMANLSLKAENYALLDAPRTRESLVYGKVFVDLRGTVKGPLDALTLRGSMNLLGNTNVTYVLTDSPLTVEDRLGGLVTFTSFDKTASAKESEAPAMSLGGMEMFMSVHIDDAVRLRADLSPDRSNFLELEGGGDLNMQYSSRGDLNLTGRYTLSGGIMKYSLPVIPLKEFRFNPGSHVDWRGDAMNPALTLKATERMRASVADAGGGSGSRMVNFDVSISIKNRLEAPELSFDLAAPDDATVENELRAMGTEERSKQAITMLVTGIYWNNRGKGGGLTMGSALNSVLQSQINSLAGNLKNTSFSMGIEDRTSSETGDKQTDYSFRYSQRFFNDRVQVVIGGKVSTGANATNNVESFIDNISLEYRLDVSGTRYVRVFYDKNYESLLDGEITETGVGIVLRRKMDRLGELFLFKKKKRRVTEAEEETPIN